MAEDFDRKLERLLSSLLEKGFKFSLKTEQRQAIESLYQKKDVMAILPTGFGKSLIFQLLVLMARPDSPTFPDKRPVVLVISPLISIINDQVLEIKSFGLAGCNLDDLLDDLDGLAQMDIVYASAESVLDKRFLEFLKRSQFTKRVAALVVDESHTVQTWTGMRKDKNSKATTAFRSAYGKLASLRSFLGQETPIAALTGTADAETKKTISSLLVLKDPLVVSVSPNRANVRFHIFDVKKKEMFERLSWLIDAIKSNGASAEKTIIFCRTMNDIARVVNYLLLNLGDKAYEPSGSHQAKDCLIGVYHSNTWKEQKDHIMESLKHNGKVRIIVASSALSMGVNFPNIRYIVHWGPARNLLNHHQEAGRAGRDGKQSHNIVIFHGQQLSHCNKEVKEFVRSGKCYRMAAYLPFDPDITSSQPSHLCCSNCAKICKCEGKGCSYMLPFAQEKKETHPVSFLTRPVTEEDKADLKSALNELRESISQNRSLFDPVAAHGFSDELIEDITEKCSTLFTTDDIFDKCAVYSIRHALLILEIIQEVFLDIPNFDDTMQILHPDSFTHISDTDYFYKSMQDLDILDDTLGQSSEDEWSDSETIES